MANPQMIDPEGEVTLRSNSTGRLYRKHFVKLHGLGIRDLAILPHQGHRRLVPDERGSWGGDGNKPTRMSCWCLSKLGWITPKNVAKSSTLKALKLAPLAQDDGDPFPGSKKSARDQRHDHALDRANDGTPTGIALSEIALSASPELATLKAKV